MKGIWRRTNDLLRKSRAKEILCLIGRGPGYHQPTIELETCRALLEIFEDAISRNCVGSKEDVILNRKNENRS